MIDLKSDLFPIAASFSNGHKMHREAHFINIENIFGLVMSNLKREFLLNY